MRYKSDSWLPVWFLCATIMPRFMAFDSVEKTVIFGGLGIVLVLLLMFGGSLNSPQTPQSAAEKKAEDERSSRVALAANMANAIKKSMRDPDSFKLNSVLIMEKTGAVCYEYRARNGFGGMNVGQAVLSSKGDLKTNEMDGFHTLWKKECAHKIGNEEATTVSYLLDHFSQ